MAHSLEKEFEWYLANQEQLVKQYNGRVIVVKDERVIGDYADVANAVEETSKIHPKGTFLVQKCTPGNQDYTAVFHSRVA